MELLVSHFQPHAQAPQEDRRPEKEYPARILERVVGLFG